MQTDQNLRQLLLDKDLEANNIYYGPEEDDIKPMEMESMVNQPAAEVQVKADGDLQPYSVVKMMSFRCCLYAGILHSEEDYRDHVLQVHGVNIPAVVDRLRDWKLCQQSTQKRERPLRQTVIGAEEEIIGAAQRNSSTDRDLFGIIALAAKTLVNSRRRIA